MVFSELLQKHISMTATQRGETLVDRHKGFDLYLMETPVNEVYAVGLLRIKREMLIALANGLPNIEVILRFDPTGTNVTCLN